MARTTTASQSAPACARSREPSISTAGVANRTTVRSTMSSAMTTFEPPPRTSACCSPRSSERRVATICSVVVQVMIRRATGPTRSVVSGATGT